MSAQASLRNLLVGLWRHLRSRRRAQFIALLLLMLVSVIAEVVSLGAVIPFIGILAAPEVAMANPMLAAFARLLGASTSQELVVPLTVIFGVAAIVAGAVRLTLIWASTRFTFAMGADLSLEVYRRTLYQPYEVHIRRSSSEIISGIATKVGGTMLGVVLPITVFTSQSLLLIAIMAALVLIDPFVAVISAAGFGSSYVLVTWVTKGVLRRNSRFISAEQTEVVKALQEGLGGIRDVLLSGTQAFYSGVYQRADTILRRAQGTNIFLAQSPKPIIEALGIALIAVLAYMMSRRSGGISHGLPVLAALALGAQRLLPALQSCFASWASIVGSEGALEDTIRLLDQPIDEEFMSPPPEALAFTRTIRFDRVRFRYGADLPWALDNFDFAIARGVRVGIVGGTGGGKSTALDLLMGLLRPTEGAILIDDLPLDRARIRAWQQNIAHVPQSIYLADATMAENIAFGVPRGSIDMARVKLAAERAHIAEFIEGGSQGYDAMVGERGVRLSGGQRQRIGIARALYKEASVLVLDEATSALDNITESAVMEAIESLDRELTIVVIAHRLSTVRRCDVIVQIEQGQIVAQGSYDELLNTSRSFEQMARASSQT